MDYSIQGLLFRHPPLLNLFLKGIGPLVEFECFNVVQRLGGVIQSLVNQLLLLEVKLLDF